MGEHDGGAPPDFARRDLVRVRVADSCCCAYFSQGLGVAASLSTSTRRHLDLRHGEGPLDLVWWLGHHAYPRLTGDSSTASHGWRGWPVASAFCLLGRCGERCMLGLRFGILEDIYVPTEQLAEEEWWL